MPVAKMLQNVGGTSTLLGLVAMAKDVEGLYAAVKALVCVVKSSKQALHDLDRIRGYQVSSDTPYRKVTILLKHFYAHIYPGHIFMIYMVIIFYAPLSKKGVYCFAPVCPVVRLSVHPRYTTLSNQ